MTIDRSIGNYHDSSNARIRKIGSYVGSAVYVAGGDPVTPADFGLGKIEAILFAGAIDAAATAIYFPVYNAATGTVAWFSDATGVEVVAGVDLSAFAARFEAIGY